MRPPVKISLFLLTLLVIIIGAESVYRLQSAVWASPPAANSDTAIEEVVPLRRLQEMAAEGDLRGERWEKTVASASIAQRPFTNPSASTRNNLLGENVPPPNQAIEQFKDLYLPWATQLLGPGWLHQIRQEEHPDKETPMAQLDNGVQVPSTYVMEEWFFLNETGQVSKGVFLMRDLSSQIIQASVYQDNTWRNLTNGEEWSDESTSNIRLDLGFLSRMSTVYEEGGQLFQEEASLDGKSVLMFTYELTHEPPLVLDDFSQVVKQTRGRAYIDPESGALLASESVFVSTSGKEYIIWHNTLLTTETVANPPEEILAYLEEVK